MSTPIALQGWAARWNIPAACLADLLQCMGTDGVSSPPSVPAPPDASEAWSQSLIRLEAPRHGVWLTRNNVGARTIVDDDGKKRHIRWGLANESPKQNEVCKSGDLIGIRPITVTAAHVGQTIGQFVSRECKRPGWKFTGNAHEQAQANWAALVIKYGGDAKFATGEGSFR